MASNNASLKNLILLFQLLIIILAVSFYIINFPTTEAAEEEVFTYFISSCAQDATTTTNSTFQGNVKTLLSSLSSKATVTRFYNNAVRSRNASDTVYGLFMCRGDIPSHLCAHCILNATQTLSSYCNLSNDAVIWGLECMVRYSNTSFFSTDDQNVVLSLACHGNVSNHARFKALLGDTINKTVDEAIAYNNSPIIGNRYFATKEAKFSENQTLYCLAQCTQDLSPQNCTTCLTTGIGLFLDSSYDVRLSGKVFFTSCNLRYELYPFYYHASASQQGGGLLPATKHLESASKSSQDHPNKYLFHNCSNYTYPQETIDTLLFYLSSNATNRGFYKTDLDATLFGLFMCRADIPNSLCGQCVSNATRKIVSECPESGWAIIWYDHCLVRYSDENFLYKMSTNPRYDDLNVTKVSDVEGSFKFTILSNALAMVPRRTAYATNEKYSTRSFILNDNQTLYVLAQCTQDLSSGDCYVCLYNAIESGIPWSRLASVGGRVLSPSCTLRFELFQFYMNIAATHNHSPPPPPRLSPVILPPRAKEEKDRSRTIIIIVVPIVVSVILFSFCCYLLWKKTRRQSYILKENFGNESTTVESLQFDLATIKAATNNFSHENKIGKGGFGEVYKGVLPDERHIAAKKLSKSSKQGITEFKNEILLIAKLQHRNLVTFIGFCLDDQEKILIYEYVPNKSLDYFLFDSRSGKVLNWSERRKIMEGIARGVLYLHEYSRLKVIHRDLKPSNILLDENMNPKISDFGLAKIIEIDQQEGATNKIVGTLGYMSPEYVMLGQFSEKSDVFSFGVMVLEIITGKKNVTSQESRRFADGLLSLVWRQFRNQTPLNILDPKLKEGCNEDEFEVIRSIHIGLLCVQEDPNDRPSMMEVVSYFTNSSIELPSPREPAFFLRQNTDPGIVLQDSSSNSVNMMSTSNLISPR